MRLISLLAAGAFAFTAAAQTTAIYVAPDGSDAASGTSISTAVATLPTALQKARDLRLRASLPVEIRLRAGTYFLDAPLQLDADDSGLVITGYRGEHPVLSGGAPISSWREAADHSGLWEAGIPAVRSGAWKFHELFLNGRRLQRSRLPKSGFFHIDGFSPPGHPTELPVPAGTIDPSWPRRGDVELIALQAWAQSRNQIGGLDPSGRLVSLAGDALANNSESHGRFWIENAPGPLAPGEWFLDAATGLLRYRPKPGESLSDAHFTAPRLTRLLRLQGSTNQLIHHVMLRGLIFADTDWPLTLGADMDIQGAVECAGAVQAEWAQDCAIEQCAFTRLGGFAVDFGSGCQRDRIEGNDMFDLGAGGIRLGDTDMGRANSFPTRRNIISDNHIHDIGRVNLPGVGILVFLSGQNLIAHNEIDHTDYTPISVGWSWGYAPTPAGGNIVEFNHLHDYGRGLLSDMGAVYTLGVQSGTIVRDNLIHDASVFGYGGWGLYTDEGSSGIILESNIVYHCQSAGFHQHYGESNIFCNNLFAFNQEAQLARTRVEKHLSLSFSNNIVIFNTGKLLTGNWGDDLAMDHNLYFDTRATNSPLPAELAAWQKRGHDLHSIIADPEFKNAARFDFRLARRSPALQIGFHPFTLRDAGPRPGKLFNYNPRVEGVRRGP